MTKWNFHRYFSNDVQGLIGHLVLKKDQNDLLKNLRKKIRQRTKLVFDEAKELVRVRNGQSTSLTMLKSQVAANTSMRYLSPRGQEELALLIFQMDQTARNAFMKLTPRFWTQGSFQYNTLNKPYSMPPQEMDIDDGTYLPMDIFEGRPVIGHRLLMLLVDTSLKSLERENSGWIFEAKPTCARIRIPHLNTHVDVPMYAIPEDKFMEKQLAMEAAALDSANLSKSLSVNAAPSIGLDSDCVNLAIRDGDKWIKSDPKIVEDWFNDCCERIGDHLRMVCRFMKAWRDAQWAERGPSSILLMAATVKILDRVPHDRQDFGSIMKIVSQNIESEFLGGVLSPDHTDEKLLFPSVDFHGERERGIMEKLSEFKDIILKAEYASDKSDALRMLNSVFGERVNDSSLIVGVAAVPAYIAPPKQAAHATRISPSMSSGKR